LLKLNHTQPMPGGPHATRGRKLRGSLTERQVEEFLCVGQLGYFAGPKLHIIDPFGVTDPLIARLPAFPASFVRPGQIHRHYAQDYTRTVQLQKNVIRDKNLAQYYDKLKLIVSGPLWSWERIKAIYAMNTGQYDPWVRNYRPDWRLSDFDKRTPEGGQWNAAGNVVLGGEGIAIDLEGVRHHTAVDISLDGNDTYLVEFRLKDGEPLRMRVPPAGENMRNRHLDLNPDDAKVGYDRLRISPIAGDGNFSIGHVILR
jgi:hypothetical protein